MTSSNINTGRSLLEANYKTSSDVLLQKIDGEAVLLNLSNENYYGLNEVGVRFWDLLQACDKTSVILDTLHGEYAAQRDILEHDVAALISELLDSNLIFENQTDEPPE